ncbi:ABC transporter permease [Enterococcus sp. BWB1-3]|uniref:ABC transporter permease n=1 Tax=Enterococcus sp. BWB1-3 TaxID=2787713 RepID=UPI001920DC54|nr:ABC transporter permease [Enterococcus sp. BWB1-3]MBL1228783.1 ABC transporter permease [Enterococcus sp. BWB1-3]
MLTLMQNEVGKVSKLKLLLIWLGALAVVIAVTGIIMIGLGNDGKIISLVEENIGNVGEGADIWRGWPIAAEMFGTLFTKAAFLIFEGYLISSLIIDEFKNRTINQLFSYPIKKSLIVWSKILIVIAFAFIAQYSAQLVVHLLIKLIAIMTGYSYSLSLGYLLSLGLSTLGVVLVGLIPLVFGMIKYSSVGTMISSVIIVVLICNAFPGTLAANLMNSLPFIVVSSAVSLLIVSTTILRIVKKDITIS